MIYKTLHKKLTIELIAIVISQRYSIVIRPNKKICVFTVTCQKNLGSVGRH